MSSTYLIFSTKGLYKMIWFLFPIILFIILVTFFGGIYFGYFISIAIALIAIIFAIPFLNTLAMKKSFLDLYDDKVVGKTVSKVFFKNATTFEITYQEIQSVSYQKNVVLIQTNNQIYEVQAKGCEPKVIEIIRQQKQGTP